MLPFSRLMGYNVIKTRSSAIILSSTRFTANKTEAPPTEEIVIPKRIPRSSTDILYALASTVGNDPTAAHYKYHDDPYLIPSSNITKRTFAMAQEAGRKAARWVRQEHADLFQHNEAQPPIKTFAPQMVFTEESEVNEDCLQNLIKSSEVTDAIFVYKLMQTKNITVSNKLKQSLLELLCFTNHENPLSEEFIEERWFRQGAAGKERQRKSWKDGELAEQLFQEIDPKSSQAYAAIIRGMCKYYQAERAWALFQEASEKQIDVDTKTFNALISVCHFLKESGDMRWELIVDLLTQMKQRKLLPDLGTLNACLSCVSTIGNYKLTRNATLKLLSEFKNLGIEPCLATWYYVLIIFCKERGPVSHVLVDIMNEIEWKEFKIADSKDTYFFVTAMDICRNHLGDKNLGKRLNDLLHTGNNYDLIGDSYKESVYYRHYFGLLCQTETLDKFMETYNLLVPNIYIPEPGIMEEILKTIDTNGAIDLIPRMWSDMIIFDHITRERLLNQIIKIMAENKPDPEIPSQQGLEEKFGTIAWDIFNRIDEQPEGRVQKLTFTGQMLGDILSILSRAKDFEHAKEVFTKIDKNQHQIPGNPTFENLTEYVDLCIQERSPTQAILCLQYCTENGMQADELAQKINCGLTLNEVHLSKIKSLVGEEFLKKK